MCVLCTIVFVISLFDFLFDFVFTICLGSPFVSCYVLLFVLCVYFIPLNAITNYLWNLSSLARDQT